MIQRKQTIFLLIAFILGVVHFEGWILFSIQLVATILSCYTIFLYKNRKRQATFCLLCVFVNLVWYVALAVLIHQGKLPEQLPIEACLPLIAAIFCFMARKGVQADEKLVRAADRIR